MNTLIEFKNILVVGVGLIGGSIIRSLKDTNFSGKVYGIDNNKEAITLAHSHGFIENKTENIPSDLDGLLVIFSVPVLSIEDAINKIERIIESEDVLYTDTLSVKSSILSALRNLDQNILNRFVLSHPIAGSEKSGFEASASDLFKNRLTIICPHEGNSKADLNKIEGFWNSLGSYTKKLSANDHDELFAKTSHMPHVISYALMDSLFQDLNEKTFLYSGGSLENYTRIASSDPQMWKDIMVANDKSILSSIASFKDSLDKLSKLIEENNSDGLIDFFSFVKQARDKSISIEDN